MGVHGELTFFKLSAFGYRLLICTAVPPGLWQLIHPVARPIALETLGNKKLAIDSSIWLYQLSGAVPAVHATC